MLTLGSLFDGIGGWQMAAIHNGVKPIWSSEIEKFPLALTKVRFPETIQLGDVTKIDGAKIPPVDIICSGSPCQSLSVAGKREGLQGESGLFFYTTDIIRRMREATGGKYPRFLVWENVPGALNSSGGNDFRAVLEAIAETEIPMPPNNKWAYAGLVQCDRCEIAWRCMDAQYWGVPQRRNRVWLVADFAESDRRAKEILFVEPSSCRNNPQGEGTQKGIAGSTADSVGDAITLRERAGKPGGGKGPLLAINKSGPLMANTNDQVLFESHPNDSRVTGPVGVAPTISARYGTGGGNTPIILNDQGGGVMNVQSDDKVGTLRAEAHGNNPIVLESNQNHATVSDDGVCPTLPAAMGMGGGHIPSIVFEPGVATRDGGHIYTDDKAPTLRANPGDNFPTVACAAAFKPEQGATARGLGYAEEQSPTLTGNTPAVVYGICSKDSNSMKSGNPHSGIYETEVSRTLDTGGANPNCNQGGNVVVYALEGNGSRPSHQGKGYSDSGKMYTLNTIEQHAVAQPINKVITYDIKKTVLVRKHPVDIVGLNALLRYSLKESGLTRKELAERLNVPQTQVDHYFRTDSCFAIPEKEIWYPLKKLLGITTTYFDAQVTEFIEKECNFDSSNRVYDERGIAPAITSTNADKMILQSTDAKKQTWATGKGSFLTNFTEDVSPTLMATDWKEPPVVVTEDQDETDNNG